MPADLASIGGTIEAQNAAVLTAGRDIRIASTTKSAAGPHGSATALDRLATVYVGNPGGTLVARGPGCTLSNAGADGVTSVQAGRDIELATVATPQPHGHDLERQELPAHQRERRAGQHHRHGRRHGAGRRRDTAMRQGTVDAGTGALSLQAGHDTAITAGQSSQTYEEASRKKTSGLLSSTTRTTVDALAYIGAGPAAWAPKATSG